MTFAQGLILAILAATVAMFLWGRWRHDMVALAALLACVFGGLVPASEVFAGFGHPAVITVACVLILSHGLQASGAVDALARAVLPRSAGPTVAVATLTALATVLSAFMNNVGALALLMPVALQVARRLSIVPGKVLMPLAFGSILGGMTTLIGTPPNLIVSGFRASRGEASFAMFDFTPVGLAIATVGVLFITFAGRRLIPRRDRPGAEGFETGTYLTEARVTANARAAGMTLQEVEQALGQADAQIVSLLRNEARIPAPNPYREVHPGDILVIEAEPENLATALSSLGLKLEEEVRGKPDDPTAQDVASGDDTKPAAAAPAKPRRDPRKDIESGEIVLTEMAVLPASPLVGRSATDIRLRTRFGINLLAVSRQGGRLASRLRTMALREGDVLLLQGAAAPLGEFASSFGCVPLAERDVRIPDRRRAVLAAAILVAAVAGAAFGLLPAAVAFSTGVLASMATNVVSPRTVYAAVDWPVVVLLGALMPVAAALESTGTADMLARLLLDFARGDAVLGLAAILVITMTLSDFMNNAATAAVMCPVAIGAATRLGASADPFLMAVAVGASCAFLTPIGHQNNTLILGPGGFRFGDYWRLGLPLEILVVAVGVPAILRFWPL